MIEQYGSTPKAIACPVCTGSRGVALYRISADQAAQHFVLRETSPERHQSLAEHVARLWGQPACDMIRCADCGFCFADPYVAGDARFYELAYERTFYSSWKWEFERTLRAIVELQRAGRLSDFTLLEIGAGNGAFVRRVTPALTAPAHVVCTEYSAIGKQTIESLGVTCLARDVRELPAADYAGRFDVICLFQVLEHLDRLDALFEHLRLMASERMHLFIAVPNARRVEFNELHGSLLDMPPNHVGRWTIGSFEIMAQRHGWRIVEHEAEAERPRDKAIQHVAYRYRRQRQTPGTLANRIERVRSRSLRRALQAAACGCYALAELKTIWQLIRTPDLGGSQWVHLERDAR